MEDLNIGSTNKVVENNNNKETEEKFLIEAEKVVNRIVQQYEKLLELSKKHNIEEKDSNFMFNELKKVHDNTKKSFKDVDKTSGFSFKR
jgi:DNA-binding ferritin-like protein